MKNNNLMRVRSIILWKWVRPLAILFGWALAAGFPVVSNAQIPWGRPELIDPNGVEMRGGWGEAYQRATERIGQFPYTVPYLLADLNFGMSRSFTNYSGDISGRFLELAASISTTNNLQPPTLREVMDQVTKYQKEDGHFGAKVNWNQPIDFQPRDTEAKMMPILWGNGRLLLGLVAAYEKFGDARLLESARKLAGFYENIVVKRFCDPKLISEYRKPSGYAGAYVTCVFEGMEGLVQLHRITKEQRYLEVAKRMADFHEAFDTLPVDHSHGSLSQHTALLLLYEATGDTKYLKRVIARWEAAVKGGYVSLVGGVLEKFWSTGFNRDEGCAEADWLRLNLMLWRNTGETRYLDMAERELWAEYPANQWPTGGFGHRFIACDNVGPFAFQNFSEEAVWCCCFHGALGLHHLKAYLAVGDEQGVRYNFPVDFVAPVIVGKNEWLLTSETLPSEEGTPVRCKIVLEGTVSRGLPLFIRIPEWCDKIVVKLGDKESPVTREASYFRTPPVNAGSVIEINYRTKPYLEKRGFERIHLPETFPADFEKVAVRYGPQLFVNANSGDTQNLELKVKPDGTIELPQDSGPVVLGTMSQIKNRSVPHAFLFNVHLVRIPGAGN